MPVLRRASIRDLATAAYELDARVLEGQIHRSSDNEQWMVGDISLDDWVEQFADQQVYVIIASLDDERPIPPKVCGTCGDDYVGAECPRCRTARMRLRGR